MNTDIWIIPQMTRNRGVKESLQILPFDIKKLQTRSNELNYVRKVTYNKLSQDGGENEIPHDGDIWKIEDILKLRDV